MRGLRLTLLAILVLLATLQQTSSHGDHPFSKIAIKEVTFALSDLARVKASPLVLGLTGQNAEWVTVEYSFPLPTADDWIGVFSPANFSASTCPSENWRVLPPLLCTAPIKYQYANYSSPQYLDTGKGSLKLQIINQRSDFSFALFTGGFLKPKLVAVSNKVTFSNPNAPAYPRLAQGATWNEMTVSWTSGYGISEAEPSVEWGRKGGHLIHSPAGTQTLKRSTMCGIHTSWDIGSSIVHTFGVTNTSLEHLLILVKIHDSVLSFLVTWERAKWMVLVNIIFSLALLTL